MPDTKDVEMKAVDDKSKSKDEKDASKKKEGEKKEEEKPKPPPTPNEEIKTNLALIEKAVLTLEPRFTHRALRTLTALKKRLTVQILIDAINAAYVKDSPIKATLLAWLPPTPPAPPATETAMEVDSAAVAPDATKPAPVNPEPLPEGEVYLRLLILYILLGNKDTYEKAISLSHETVEKIRKWNRRSMDALAGRVFYALARSYELGSELELIRPLLSAAQRTAALRQDDELQAALLNLLIRNYLHYDLYDQADKLVAKATFPTSAANSQICRNNYFLARIKTVQLNYSDAHTNLQQAIRRAPPAKTAPGFYQALHKLSVVVDLLMGEIPERSLFRHPVLEKVLAGYLEIVRAVRIGDLAMFQTTLSNYAPQFLADKTYPLIVRLRQNVIKAGVRRLSLSYSRISLRDICIRLHLDSEEDAEYIVGKAIRDGVMEGKIIHEKGWVECGGGKGGYGPEVADNYGRRIDFCLELHNESIKAMRYPLNAHRKELAAAAGAREREKELAKEIENGTLEEDDGDF